MARFISPLGKRSSIAIKSFSFKDIKSLDSSSRKKRQDLIKTIKDFRDSYAEKTPEYFCNDAIMKHSIFRGNYGTMLVRRSIGIKKPSKGGSFLFMNQYRTDDLRRSAPSLKTINTDKPWDKILRRELFFTYGIVSDKNDCSISLRNERIDGSLNEFFFNIAGKFEKNDFFTYEYLIGDPLMYPPFEANLIVSPRHEGGKVTLIVEFEREEWDKVLSWEMKLKNEDSVMIGDKKNITDLRVGVLNTTISCSLENPKPWQTLNFSWKIK